MASGQNSQLAQGALFLIDSTGPCPTGKKYRTFIDAAIAHHLTQHTYYYQDRGRPGAKNTKRATFRKFRNSLQALWENVKPESRGRKDRDRVEALFTLKSEAITPRALRTYGYDPETFSETDLPVFVDEGDDNLQPREQAQTASTPAPRSQQAHTSVPSPKRKSEFSDEPQQHATKRVRTEELIAETDRKDRTSHSSRSPQELVPAPLERMEEELQTSDGTQLQAAKRPRTSGNPVSDAGYKGSSARMPRCRPCIQSKKGCDRQRPCGRCRAAGIGVEGCIAAELPERGENQIATENNDTTSPSNRQINHSPPRAPQVPLPGPSTGSKRGLESSHEPQQQAAKRGRFDNPVEITEHGKPSMKLPRCKRCIQEDAVDCDRQRPCSNCKAAGIDRQGCAGAEQNSNLHVGVESDVSTTKNATRPRSTPQIQPNTKNYGPGMPHDPLVESESPNADDARASLGKRKRGPDDTGTAAGHGGVQTTSASDQSAPSKRQATASIVEASPADEHANLAAKLLEGTPSGASHAANDNTAAFANENIESDPLDDTLNPKPQPKPREITGSDLGAFSDSLKKSQKDVELAALAILACIGHISNILCPLDLKPSEHLAVLYVRCWGAEWKEVAVEALKRGGFRTPFVTMSLISAFLYDRILNQKAYNKELAQDFIKQLEESGPTGEAMLKALHWPKRGKSSRDYFIQQITNTSQSPRLLQIPLLSQPKMLGEYWPKTTPLFEPNYRLRRRLLCENSGISRCPTSALTLRWQRPMDCRQGILKKTCLSCLSHPSLQSSGRPCTTNSSWSPAAANTLTSGHLMEKSSSPAR